MKNLFHSNWGWIQLNISVVSSFLTVEQQKNEKFKFALFRQNFLLCCFASAVNRTRAYRVAGDNSTTEPPLLDLNCWNRSSKVLLIIQVFHQSVESKSWKRRSNLIEASNSANYLSTLPLFWQWNNKKLKKVKLRFSRKIFLLFCFASPGNRTMVSCVERENATTEPPMLDFNCFNRLNKNFALHFIS